MRDDSLNATNAFAAIGPDGKRRSDGLHRDQFGGTLGGPIVAGQAVLLRRLPGHAHQRDADQLLPVRADGGDAGGRFLGHHVAGVQRGPHDRAARAVRRTAACRPALFSPAALSLAAKLPKPINECGQSRSSIARPRAPSTWRSAASTTSGATATRSSAATSSRASRRSRTTIPNNVLAYANGPIDDTVHSFVARRHLPAGTRTRSTRSA